MHVLRKHLAGGCIEKRRLSGFCFVVYCFSLLYFAVHFSVWNWKVGQQGAILHQQRAPPQPSFLSCPHSAENSTEHWQSKKFLQQVTVISWSNICSSEYDLSFDIFIFDDSMQVTVNVNYQWLIYILFLSLCVHSFLCLWKPAGSRYIRWYLSSVFSVSCTHASLFVVEISLGITKLNKHLV